MDPHEIIPEDKHKMETFCRDCFGPVKRVYWTLPRQPVTFSWVHASWKAAS